MIKQRKLNKVGGTLMNFSKRITTMQQSPIRKLFRYAANAKKQGKKVYHLNIGQPDIETPANFMNAIMNFDRPVLEYSASQGVPKLIDGIAQYYRRYNMYFEEDEILITNGGSEAILFSLITIADSGDEIIIPEPFYSNYNTFASAVDVNIVPIVTTAENGFHLPPKEQIEKAITDRTRGILLTHPGNPTGVVYTKDEIQCIAEIAQEHDLFILSDEVYREFVYDGLEYISFGNIPEIQDRVILIDSISKRFSACGARIGAILCKNKKLIEEILKLCQGRLCSATLEQIGAAEIYHNLPEDYFKKVREEYQKRRDIVYEGLKSIPGVICQKPTGSFYVIAKLPVSSAEDFLIWLLRDFELDNETLMLAPAEGFYATEGLGKDEVRIAYILKEEDLRKSMKILKTALEMYPGK